MDPVVLIVVIILVLWAVGAFGFPNRPGGNTVHTLLVLVLVLILLRVFKIL